MTKNKLIIFDLDGVLFDSTNVVNAFIMTSYPTMTPEKMNEILSGNFHEEMEQFRLNNAPLTETEEERKSRYAEFALKKSKSPLYAGILELLQSLHKEGYILTINTSALQKSSFPLLENMGIRDLFDFIGTKEISLSKVEKFKIIRERYNISNEHTLFITDTLGDIREAEIANVPTIAVTWGAHDRSCFKQDVHKNLMAIVDTVDELRDYIYENIK